MLNFEITMIKLELKNKKSHLPPLSINLTSTVPPPPIHSPSLPFSLSHKLLDTTNGIYLQWFGRSINNKDVVANVRRRPSDVRNCRQPPICSSHHQPRRQRLGPEGHFPSGSIFFFCQNTY